MLNRAGLVDQVVDDERPIALMVFLDGVAFGNAVELGNSHSYFLVIHGFADVRAGNQTELAQLGVEDIPEGHKVGAPFFQGGKVLLQIRFGAAFEAWAELAGPVPDHFVQAGHQVGGLFAVFLADGDFLRRGGEFL